MDNFCRNCSEDTKFNICPKCYNAYIQPSDRFISHAFDTSLTSFEIPQTVQILDLAGTSISKIDWKNHDDLKILRLSNCEKLESISLLNCRGLKCLDLSNCPKLTKISLESTYNIRTIDLSNCISLKKFDCDMLAVEYMSIANTQIDELGYYPIITYLDFSNTKVTDISILSSFTMLENVKFNNVPIQSCDLGFLTFIPRLCAIETNIPEVTFSSVSPSTLLVSLYLKDCKSVTDAPKLRNFSLISPKGKFGRGFKVPMLSGDWTIPYRLIFGPYPSPPGEKIEIDPQNIQKIQHPEFDGTIAANQIAGLFYGAVFGEIFGRYINGLTKEYVTFILDHPIDITWARMISMAGEKSVKGCFSDDFKKNLNNLAKFAVTGEIEKVENDFDALLSSALVASYLFWDEEKLIEKIRLILSKSEFSEEIKFSCILISLLIANLLQQRLKLAENIQIDEIFEKTLKIADITDRNTYETCISITKLSQLKNVSEKLTPTAAAVFSIRKGYSWSEGFSKVLYRGGNTLTNGIITGAVLGARWGYDDIPIDLIHFLYKRNFLDQTVSYVFGSLEISRKELNWDELPGIQWEPAEDTIPDPFAYQRME